MFTAAATLAALAMLSSPPAPTQDPMVFGMSTALTGPIGLLGDAVRAGVSAAFHERNIAGGIGGRALELLVLDDMYEPTRTAPNMRELIERRNCLAIIGNVGTPTAVASIPICRESGTTLFASFSGSSLLRPQPPDPLIINYRASYAEETAAMVDALVEIAKLRPDEIAFFTQRDAYGDAGYSGGLASLNRHGLTSETLIAHGRYERNTLNVENALADILSAQTPPRAVIMVGAYGPCARFLKLAREADFDAIFLGVSFVGASALAEEGGDAADGVIITEVTPNPESDLPAARRFREALAAHDPTRKPTHAAFEGYLAGRTLLLALERADAPVTRSSVSGFLRALGTFDLGLGAPLTLSETEHQASHAIWPSVIEHGRVAPADWSRLAPDFRRTEVPAR